MARGRLITVEGIDGAGKSTLSAALADALRERGLDIDARREPGGVEAAERIRALVVDPALRIGARAEALLYAAARAQLVEEALAPALAAGRWVLLDRFLDSSLAYQGVARGLGVDVVRRINEPAVGDLVPDVTVLLTLDHDAAAARGAEADRFENEGAQLQRAVAEAYEALAAAEPERWRRVDAGRDPDAVHADVLAAVGTAGG
jgi:dTMP kinase